MSAIASNEPIDRYRIDTAALVDGRVIVDWADGHRSTFAPIWLRYSPFFPGSLRRAGPDGRFFRPGGPDLAPDRMSLTDTGDLRIVWQPGELESVFEAHWLRASCYSTAERARRRRAAATWDAGIARGLPAFGHQALCEDDAVRLALFHRVIDHGFAVVRGVPTVPGEVATVSRLFGTISPAPYADDPAAPGVVDVRVDPAVPVATRKAYFLAPHTDTCWRQTQSGLVLMHCLQAHAHGGRSMLVDGFEVAGRLRDTDPKAFALLATVPLDFGSKVADGDEWRALGRVISRDADGEIVGVRYNANSVDQLDLPEALVEPVYGALEHFEQILHDRALWLEIQLQPGDLLVMDNQRVLHGRTAFDPSSGPRHLQTCAVERDDFHRTYRRLACERGDPRWSDRLSGGVV